jgi:hypothetical protein
MSAGHPAAMRDKASLQSTRVYVRFFAPFNNRWFLEVVVHQKDWLQTLLRLMLPIFTLSS